MTYPSGKAITYGYDLQGQVTAIEVDSATILDDAAYRRRPSFGSL